MKNKNLLIAAKLIVYFETPFFIGGFFNLLGRVESLPDYFFLKLSLLSLAATILCYLVEKWTVLPKEE